jgi:hypothetical protein
MTDTEDRGPFRLHFHEYVHVACSSASAGGRRGFEDGFLCDA